MRVEHTVVIKRPVHEVFGYVADLKLAQSGSAG